MQRLNVKYTMLPYRDTQATGLAYACLFIDSVLCIFVDCKIKINPPERYIGFLLQSKADLQSERLK